MSGFTNTNGQVITEKEIGYYFQKVFSLYYLSFIAVTTIFLIIALDKGGYLLVMSSWLIVCIFIFTVYYRNIRNREHVLINSFVGKYGFAFFKYNSKTKRLITGYEYNFNELTDLVIKQTQYTNYGIKTPGVHYKFIWYNASNIIFEATGVVNKKKPYDFATDHEQYECQKAAEREWTLYLKPILFDEMKEKSVLEFFRLEEKTDKLKPYVRLSEKYISIQQNSRDNIFLLSEIKNVEYHNPYLTIVKKGDESFLAQPLQRQTINLTELSNSRCFLELFQQLTKIVI